MRAIGPVLATVILIAITLIASIAIAGFVFGLFGTFTAESNVQVNGGTCHPTWCVLTLSNTGTATGQVIGASQGWTVNATSISPGSTISLRVDHSGILNSTASGSLSLSNGGKIYWDLEVQYD